MKNPNIKEAVRIREGKAFFSAKDLFSMIPEIDDYKGWIELIAKEVKLGEKEFVKEGREFIKAKNDCLLSPKHTLTMALTDDDDNYEIEGQPIQGEYNKAVEELTRQLIELNNWNEEDIERLHLE